MVISSKTCRKLIYFQLLLVMVEMFFISQFHLPSIITYITDIVSVILLLYMAYLLHGPKQRGDIKMLLQFILSII